MTTRNIGGSPKTYTYGDAAHKDAPTAYDGDTYTYDAAGNQITHSNGVTTQQRTFDPENRLVRIVDGSTISEFVYDANGNRVFKSVSTNGSRERTAYIGGLYEEELTGSANPPYINYYSLGGKMVAMRRANQASMNGQYRMVSDHLGSASMLVDTSGPPVVVQRQYFKAYGQTAYTWSSGGSLSDIGYTGQRTEGSTGLMFYNARFYDPQLSYFASADTIGVDKGLSQSRNRYAYVLNNPLGFTDPTGHEEEPPRRSGNCERDHGDACREREAELKRYGFTIADLGTWDIRDLVLFLQSIRDLMGAAGWDIEAFRNAIGDVTLIRESYAVYEGERQNWDAAFDKNGPDDEGAPTITVYDQTFSDESQDSIRAKVAFVHEMAHAWDFRMNNYDVSARMMKRVGASEADGGRTYYPGPEPPVSFQADDNRAEDWAESVAATVYPQSDRYRTKGADPETNLYRAPRRARYVQEQFKFWRTVR